MRQQSSTNINLQQVRDLSIVQHVYVCTLPVVQPTYVRDQSILQRVYTYEQLRFFFSSHTQLLCNLQSHSLMSFTVQSDPQSVTTHPISSTTHSCSSTIQYECYSSCISNQNTIASILALNHKSVSHSINQYKPHHNNHTKNALSIHHTTNKSIHQDKNITIPEFLWKI
jgi:hypothetical protein